MIQCTRYCRYLQLQQCLMLSLTWLFGLYLGNQMNGPYLPDVHMGLRPQILNLTLQPEPTKTLAILKADCTVLQVSNAFHAIQKMGFKITCLNFSGLPADAVSPEGMLVGCALQCGLTRITAWHPGGKADDNKPVRVSIPVGCQRGCRQPSWSTRVDCGTGAYKRGWNVAEFNWYVCLLSAARCNLGTSVNIYVVDAGWLMTDRYTLIHFILFRRTP